MPHAYTDDPELNQLYHDFNKAHRAVLLLSGKIFGLKERAAKYAHVPAVALQIRNLDAAFAADSAAAFHTI